MGKCVGIGKKSFAFIYNIISIYYFNMRNLFYEVSTFVYQLLFSNFLNKDIHVHT